MTKSRKLEAADCPVFSRTYSSLTAQESWTAADDSEGWNLESGPLPTTRSDDDDDGGGGGD